MTQASSETPREPSQDAALPGAPYPLGATWDGRGVNFALFSEHATGVELCLFDSPDTTTESTRIPFTEHTDMLNQYFKPFSARPALVTAASSQNARTS